MIYIKRGNGHTLFKKHAPIFKKQQDRYIDCIKSWDSEDGGRLTNIRWNPPRISPSNELNKQFEDVLLWQFNARCAFCESHVTKDSLKLLNFRPYIVRAVENFAYENGETVNYFWLNWQWTNHYLACSECYMAQSSADNRFPINNRFPIDEGAGVKRAKPGTFEFDVLLKEKPLLVDPCYDKPYEHIQLKWNDVTKIVEIIDLTEAGKITIQFFNLNRLVPTLTKAAIAFRKSFDAYIQEPTNMNKEELFEKCNETNADAEFIGMHRWLLKQWLETEAESLRQEWKEKSQPWFKLGNIDPPILFPPVNIKEDLIPNPKPKPKPKPKKRLKDNMLEIIWNKVTKDPKAREEIKKVRRPVEEIFRQLFRDDDQLIVENMFNSGYSGALVFHVEAVNGGKANIPSVVKIDEHRKIKQEYDKMVPLKNKVPNGSYAALPPAQSTGIYSGLKFEFGGDGLAKVTSLKQYMLDADWTFVQRVLDELLIPPMNRFWDKEVKNQFPWCYYDGQLPANFVLEIVENPSRVDDQFNPMDMDFVNWEGLKNGATQIVEVSGFEVTAVTPTHIKLNAPSGSRKDSFKIKVNIENISRSFTEDEILEEPIYGRIIQKRLPYLQKIAKDVLHMSQFEGFDPNNPVVVNLNDHQLSNPLESLDELLNSERATVNSSLIHGDLNLENVLVTTFADGSPRDIAIIDFASVIENAHILRDLICLEMNVWLYVVSEELDRLNMGKEVAAFFTAVHLPNQTHTKYDDLKSFKIIKQIRSHARKHLVDQQNWDEYFQGLLIYMLGALDYDNLNKIPTRPSPKALAFWVASLCNTYLKDGYSSLKELFLNSSILVEEEGGRINRIKQVESSEPSNSSPIVVIDKNAPPLSNPALLKQMYKALDDVELKQICLSLDVDLKKINPSEGDVYDNLGSGNKNSKLMNLIGFCERRGIKINLIEYLEDSRPTLKWRADQY